MANLHVVSCTACGAANGKAAGAALHRCCYCRQAVYCSAACAAADACRHAQAHALRLVFFQHRQLHFDNPVDFLPLRV